MRSTIKTLPATLPEPSSMDRRLRTGVTGAVSQSDLDSIKGVGPQGVGAGPWIAVDGLIEAGLGRYHSTGNSRRQIRTRNPLAVITPSSDTSCRLVKT